jgi:putative transposase
MCLPGRYAEDGRHIMSRFKRLSHTIYECKYHLVFCPKYRYPILEGNAVNDNYKLPLTTITNVHFHRPTFPSIIIPYQCQVRRREPVGRPESHLLGFHTNIWLGFIVAGFLLASFLLVIATIFQRQPKRYSNLITQN